MCKIIVVFGATGVQGRGFISTLSSHNTTDDIKYTVYALTRNPTSSSSTSLSKLSGVKLLKVDEDAMDVPFTVFRELQDNQGVERGGVYGVWSVQGYVDDVTMYKQGCAIADAAREFGVEHFVYSSTDFGMMDDCGITSFEVKRRVETHIRSLSFPSSTFIRPSQFMDNWLPTTDHKHKIGRTALAKIAMACEKNAAMKLCLVAGEDVGRAGAEAMVRGSGCEVDGKKGIVRLAGDEMTIKEIERVYQEEMGTPMPYTSTLLARIVSVLVPIVRQGNKFWSEHGFNIDVDQVKRERPWIMDYRSYLRKLQTGEVLS